MPARANGPKAGPTFGIDWKNLPIGKPIVYKGSGSGAKANACRANKRYPFKYKSFKKDGKFYIQRDLMPKE